MRITFYFISGLHFTQDIVGVPAAEAVLNSIACGRNVTLNVDDGVVVIMANTVTNIIAKEQA